MASVHQKGKWWYGFIRLPNGKQTSRNLGLESKPSLKKKALALAEKLEHELRKGTGAAKFQTAMRELYEEASGTEVPDARLADYIEDWLDSKIGSIEDQSIEYYRSNLNNFVRWFAENRPDCERLHQVTTRDVEAYRKHELKERSARTVNHRIKTLRMVFSKALREGMIDSNPLTGVAKAKERKAVVRPFTLGEIGIILGVADPEWRSMVLIGFYTGQRLKDISLLTWENLDLAREEITLTTSKTQREMTIPIVAPLMEHLASLPSTDDPRTPLHPVASAKVIEQKRSGALSRQFYSLMAKAGLVEKKAHRKQPAQTRYQRSPISFHSLRHAATSALKNAGVSDAMAREIIGHESKEINRVYTHFETDAIRRAMENMPEIRTES